MKHYTLQDKLIITNDFLKELSDKGWQEIELLQNQIANIEDTVENRKILQLLQNLRTSYYIFVGGIENLDSTKNYQDFSEPEPELTTADEIILTSESDGVSTFDKETELEDETPADKALNQQNEPFEYFVDFDDPIGDPITDQDLYS